jgi:hypothetical protein
MFLPRTNFVYFVWFVVSFVYWLNNYKVII